ncbi:MAG: GNAT family N-acetyltransferase, partial [Candidatus Omnitrophota bacterium]
ACIKEAKSLGAKKVFALTYKPEFFKKLKFRKISHSQLPHKVWAECIRCPKFPNCQETAVIKKL